MRDVRLVAAVLVAATLVAVPVSAFTMEPMSTLLAPSGAKSVATFRIKNDGEARIAVRLSALTRSVSTDGKEENASAAELFTLYPSRVLVEPGSSVAVKIQWKGPASVATERCFRLMAEEVPLDSGGEKGSGIHMLFRYIASIYVGDAGFKPELVAQATGAEGKDGAGILVDLENRGTRHVVAEKVRLDLVDDQGKTITLSNEELGSLNGANYLPGFSRSLFIPLAEAQAGMSYTTKITYEGEY
jgi:fimbrial chaperone protein